MQKIVKVKVPAKEAQVKDVTVTYCDIPNCEERSTLLYGGVNYAKCEICRRDLCRYHLTYDPDFQGDYATKWCIICSELYLERRREMLRRHEDEEEKLYNDVKKESLSAEAN